MPEGHAVIPNFFISARIDDDLRYDHPEVVPTDKAKRDFLSRQFENRLFDRDTFLVAHYDVNFLYVLSLYARNCPEKRRAWREAVRAEFCRRTDGRSGRPLALAHRELGGRVSGSLRTPSVGCNKCASPVSDDGREAIAATERLIRLRQTSCRRCRARAGQSPGRRRRPRRIGRGCPRCAGHSSGSSRSCARRSAARSGRPRAR